ncbi:MAG TPA: hypothetical protein VM427_07615 [Patescibacteria group bacterium]|nr:hypothetical protein [Patescibacteria group bacterium]
MRTTTLGSRRLALTGLAITALFAIGAGPGQAADPFVAGGRSTRPMAAPADHLARAETRARELTAALGISGTSHRATRLDDRFEHRIYDEVTSFDAGGRQVAISQFDLDGTVVMAVGLGWRPGSGRAVDSAGAGRSAGAVAGSVGLTVTGRPDIRASAGAGGWSVAWTRRVDGVSVRGDGVRVLLWPDGSFHGLTRSERPLAPAPPRQIDAAQARATALSLAAERFGAAVAAAGIVAIERAWIAPNDAFGPAGPDAPGATLRLAWTVRFETHGPLAERVRQIELWLDIGSGDLLGGDVVE